MIKINEVARFAILSAVGLMYIALPGMLSPVENEIDIFRRNRSTTVNNVFLDKGIVYATQSNEIQKLYYLILDGLFKLHYVDKPMCKQATKALIIPRRFFMCNNHNLWHTFECRLNHIAIASEYSKSYSMQSWGGNEMDKYVVDILERTGRIKFGIRSKKELGRLNGCFDIVT